MPCYFFNYTPYGWTSFLWANFKNINYLWILSIYDILVHKSNKYHVKNHFVSESSFCVVMKKAECLYCTLFMYSWLGYSYSLLTRLVILWISANTFPFKNIIKILLNIWWIESSNEWHLFEMKMFYKITNVFTVTFNQIIVSLLN